MYFIFLYENRTTRPVKVILIVCMGGVGWGEIMGGAEPNQDVL
jgi:hypothetical protein